MSTRVELESRWQQIAKELELIASGDQPADQFPYDREAEILAE